MWRNDLKEGRGKRVGRLVGLVGDGLFVVVLGG